MTTEINEKERLLEIFLPYAMTNIKRMRENNGRFVHYTSAASALSIIRTKEMWMRNTLCMADYREVLHGLEALDRCFKNEQRKAAFVSGLNQCHGGTADEVFRIFNQYLGNTRLQTFVASISEHDNREDLHGRLSMWRAFGGGMTARVALVFDLPMVIDPYPKLSLNFNKVGYFTDEELAHEVDTVISNVHQNIDFLKSQPPQMLIAHAYGMLLNHVVCLKHEGFHEEKEWRVIYSPTLIPSSYIKSEIVDVGGVPQVVYKIPLEDNPAAGFRLGLDNLLKRVIVGPSQFPLAMCEAFVQELNKAGVKDAGLRVVPSQIPVRT